MSTSLDNRIEAEQHDGVLRYRVKSERNPHDTYLVELDSYSGNGECSCMHFDCRLRPLLATLYTPERAIAEGKASVKPGTRPEDALRCKHIIDARAKFADDVIKAIDHDKKKKYASKADAA